MLIECTVGTETFTDPSATSTVAVYYRRDGQHEEVPLFIAAQRARDGHAVTTLRSETLAAAEGSRVNGHWTVAQYEVPEGALLKLTVTRRGVGQTFDDQARVMLRMRQGAALRRIRVEFSRHHRAVVSHGTVEGRFDIIPVEEFETYHVQEVERQLRKYAPENWEGLLEEQVLEREASPLRAPKTVEVQTVSGEKVVVTKAARRRVINLSRKK